MKLSDKITAYILELLQIAEDGEAKLKRNELAERLGCVPSQINYVLSSRFTPEQGYIVESQRGGGGYILIKKVNLSSDYARIMHTVNALGEEIDLSTARIILENLTYRDVISQGTAILINSALSTQAFSGVPTDLRDKLRATILKQMLVALLAIQ